MPEFIIHVGPHKTGTTYLQLSLKAVRPMLAARGTLYPDFWDFAPRNPSQLPLVQHLRDGVADALLPRFEFLKESGAARVLISAEDLSNLDASAVQLLRDMIGDDPVRVVFYVRRFSELIPSSWQEGIKQGQCYTMPEFLLLHLQAPNHSRLLNFDLKISVFAQAFGHDNIYLVPYSELRDRGIDIFQHFCEMFLDWADPPLTPDAAEANASRDHRDTELLRALNSIARRHGTEDGSRLRRALDAHRRKLEVTTVTQAIHRNSTRIRLNDTWPILQGLHNRIHKAYETRLVGPRQSGELFRPKPIDLRYTTGDYLGEPGVAEALLAAYEELAVVAQTS